MHDPPLEALMHEVRVVGIERWGEIGAPYTLEIRDVDGDLHR